MEKILSFIGALLIGINGHCGIQISDKNRVNAPLPDGSFGTELFSIQQRSGLSNPDSEFFINFRNKLKEDFASYKDALDSKQQFLMKEFIGRVDALYLERLTITERDKFELINQILEIAQAFYYYRHTIGKGVHGLSLHHPFFDGYIHPYWIGLKAYDVFPLPPKMAINLVSVAQDQLDKIDPQDSAFWTNRGVDVETYLVRDLQRSWCAPERIFEFSKTKTTPEEGGGKNPGLKVTTDFDGESDSFALKFGLNQLDPKGVVFQTQEAYYETGINSLYFALGYNVDTGVFCPGVTLRFQPELLDLSKSLQINRNTWALSNYYKSVVLQNGRELSLQEVMHKYAYMDHSNATPETIEPVPVEQYVIKPEYASQIAFIKTYPVYLEKRSKKSERIIRWERDGLSHEDRREIRGLVLADTWLGGVDNYGFNLKILFEKNKETHLSKMKFTLVDNGNTFAAADLDLDNVEFEGYLPVELRPSSKAADWKEFKRVYALKYTGKSDLEVQMSRFSSSVFLDGSKSKKLDLTLQGKELAKQLSIDLHAMNNKRAGRYLSNLTVDDLRWMTRKIASLKEWQIYHAMAQTGLGHPGAVLMTEKLISRRDQLVGYFNLEGELGLLRPNGPNLDLNIKGSNVVSIGGEKITIPSYGYSVKHGELFVK